MKRRWVRVVGISVAVLAVLLGGLLLVLRLTSPPPLTPASTTDLLEIPEEWLAPTAEPSAVESATQTSSETIAGTESTTEAPAVPAQTPERTFSSTGSLAFYNDGRVFGEESYSLNVDESGGSLRSTGQFQFKVVLATIRIAFDQGLELDADLVPVFYSASYDAPFGMDRDVRVDVSEGSALLGSGDDVVSVPLTDRTLVLGTFGTYALLPYFLSGRDPSEPQRFDILMLGGPPGTEDAAGNLPIMGIAPQQQVQIRARGQTLWADAYIMSSTLGESLLLSKGPEFLAFLAGDEEEGTMAVFRSDLFPDGFEIVQGQTLLTGAEFTAVP